MYVLWEAALFLQIINLTPSTEPLSGTGSPKPTAFWTLSFIRRCLCPRSPSTSRMAPGKFSCPPAFSSVRRRSFLLPPKGCCKIRGWKTHCSLQLQVTSTSKYCSKAYKRKNTSKQGDWRKVECVWLFNLNYKGLWSDTGNSENKWRSDIINTHVMYIKRSL